ncbi:penicillin-binding protein [Frankia sp. R43]|uniref:penicillin-binding transpeptidase domain-containing protein n=1 Tax=Frankia sp. R43 TaxID=269536 RepID=UPI0006CA43C1|nr:penicillin-binding transpeptidase domain-containing protein [Frankia sp. R43]KPM57270.1 penicillin-binding protein [Frankia sp. R43]
MPLTPTGFGPSRSRRRGRGRRGLLAAGLVLVLVAVGGGLTYWLKERSDARAADRAVVSVAASYLEAWQALTIAPSAAEESDTAAGGTGAAASGTGATGTAAAGTGAAGTGAAGTGAAAAGTGGGDAAAGQARARAGAAVSAVSVDGDVPVATLVGLMSDVHDRLSVTRAEFVAGKAERSGASATVPYTATLTLAGFTEPLTYSGSLGLTRAGGDAWKVRAAPSSVHPELKPGLRLDRTDSTGRRGALLDVNGRPMDTNPELAGNLIGRIDPASGLQRVYDSRLRPQGGSVVVRTDGNETVKTLKAYPSSDGEAIRTTINLDVQRAAEAALGTAAQPNGALVAIDTRTGGVLAVANRPTNGYGRAVRGSYPPGSTFKIVTATAALMNGRTADTPLDCTEKVSIGGREFQNAEAEQFGMIPFRTAFAKSCNTAFIRLEQSLPDGALEQAAKLYGFDGVEPLPIASVGGSFPTPRDDVEAAAASIGQGRVAASPLQMASVAAAVASGTWHQPFVVGESPRSNALPAQALGPLRDFMRAVVTEGTAAGVPMPGEVGGKTGTAEYGNGNPPPTHGWFVGYRGDIAVATVIEDGGFGAESAAPVVSRFFTALDGGQVSAPPAAG